MGLLTLQTRLATVLSSAQELKQEALRHVNLLNSPISIGKLFKLSNYCNDLIVRICDLYENDTDLASYADLQFATTFNLSTRIATIRGYLEDIITEINSIVSPYTQNNWHSETTVMSNGEILTVSDYSSATTSSLQVILQSVYDDIPE